MGKIPGLAISRPNGGWLGLEMIGGTFKLTFYNAKKKPVTVDVASAIISWKPPIQKFTDKVRVFLTPGGDGKSLVSERNVPPPHKFTLTINFFVSGKEDAVESYSGVDFAADDYTP